jgi:hypothetical protein
MLRKTTFALVALAALAGTALAPTSASAWGWYAAANPPVRPAVAKAVRSLELQTFTHR